MYYLAYYVHFTSAYLHKSFSTLTINNNNYLYCNIIIYKFNFFTDIIIKKIQI